MFNTLNFLNRIINPLSISDFHSGVRSHALPLIDSQDRFVLFITAKAGCTFATKWFFEQQGILEEAIKYGKGVHKYRIEIYYKRPGYMGDLKRVLANRVKKIKLVRCPYQRAVSSYIHCIKKKKLQQEISQFLGRNFEKNNTFSFEEFVDFLSSIDINTCNPHYRRQTWEHEISERLKFYRIIKLENSIDEFRDLENVLGLKRTDLGDLSDSHHHIKKMGQNDSYCGNVNFDMKVNAIDHFRNFYNAHSSEMIARIYEVDFSTYNYSKFML